MQKRTRKKLEYESYEFEEDFKEINYKYDLINLVHMYYKDYFNNYSIPKSKIVKRICKQKYNDISISMSDEYIEMMKLHIKIHVFNTCCKEEIEKRNKRYAINILYYKKILPYDLVKHKILKY